MDTPRRYVLTISCPDRTGIVAAVSNFISGLGGWIAEANHHSDWAANYFFMRHEILADSLGCDLEEFRTRFEPIAYGYGMSWNVSDTARKKRVVVMVSKQDHCLYDILHRWRSQDFEFDIPCVISNHDDLRGFVEWHGIPFHHVPVRPDNKPQAYAEVMRLFRENDGDCMVLARYMQILSEEMCVALPNRIINIHHSFLPSFVGAKPYHQAHQRGVKLIGATCHYVTADLDAGPIIEQDVIRIDHGDSPEDMVRYGRDIEKTVLARGLRYHCEDRLLVHGNKTVVFK